VSGFDELRFGPQRTLNLRESLPTASEAVRRAETWLREQQVKGAGEVLVITGRGNQSPGGVGVIRGAVEKLLFSLHRRGVVTSHHEHNPGAYVVALAPLRALSEVPGRRRERPQSSPRAPELHGLTRETMTLLRDLAERSLDMLGVKSSKARVTDEMHRYLGVIAPGLSSGPQMEEQLQQALRAAIAEYD